MSTPAEPKQTSADIEAYPGVQQEAFLHHASIIGDVIIALLNVKTSPMNRMSCVPDESITLIVRKMSIAVLIDTWVR